MVHGFIRTSIRHAKCECKCLPVLAIFTIPQSSIDSVRHYSSIKARIPAVNSVKLLYNPNFFHFKKNIRI